MRTVAGKVPSMWAITNRSLMITPETPNYEFASTREQMMRLDPDGYEELFGFLKVKDISYHSPLSIQLFAAVTGLAVLPALAFYASLRAVEYFRRGQSESNIRELEARIKEQELAQQELKTQLLKTIVSNVNFLQSQGRFDVPKEVIAEIAKTTVSPVANLASSPLVGSVTVGFSNKP